MRILFARHAESEANIQQIISNRDLPHKLTQKGISQASSLAEILLCCDVKLIVASPILRAQETAAVVAEKLSLSFSISSALREFDCGSVEGRQDEDAWAAYFAVVRSWDKEQNFDRRIQPDGESFNDMKARFLPFMTHLIKTNRNLSGDILLISHGGFLHHMLPLVLTNVDRAFTEHHPLGNCELVITHPQETQLVCTEWAGIKFI